jgi:hypothetical protein
METSTSSIAVERSSPARATSLALPSGDSLCEVDLPLAEIVKRLRRSEIKNAG